MITANEAVSGLARYVDAEILPHVEGWRKVALGAYIGLIGNNAANALAKAADSPAAALTGAFTDEGINIDLIWNYLSQAIREPVRVDIPMIGTFTLSREDCDKIYDYMRGAL